MVNEPTVELNDTDKQSLNPCFNGIWLMRLTETIFLLKSLICLNPCFNGIWLMRNKKRRKKEIFFVLILVLMEYG